MIVVYDSLTGNVEKFVNKLNSKSVKIRDDLLIEEDFLLVTYTTGFGEIPKSTIDFMKRNSNHCKGVASSGNKNWGKNFAKAADLLRVVHKVPVVHKFELSGLEDDVEKIRRFLGE